MDEHNSFFDDDAPSKMNVYRLYAEFNRGRKSNLDKFLEGRPKSIVVP